MRVGAHPHPRAVNETTKTDLRKPNLAWLWYGAAARTVSGMSFPAGKVTGSA